jgi:hypothetical protein
MEILHGRPLASHSKCFQKAETLRFPHPRRKPPPGAGSRSLRAGKSSALIASIGANSSPLGKQDRAEILPSLPCKERRAGADITTRRAKPSGDAPLAAQSSRLINQKRAGMLREGKREGPARAGPRFPAKNAGQAKSSPLYEKIER